MPKNTLSRWLLPTLALISVWLAMTVVWVAVALYSGQASGWMALVVAADSALMLRITAAPRGFVGIFLAIATTVAGIVSSYWMLTATYLGASFGIGPFDSAQRLGPVLAWDLSRMMMERGDLIALGAAPVLAGLATYLVTRRS